MEKKSYTIIFSDIDGTLLNSNHEIMPETKAAIQLAVNKGIPFVLVSARPPRGILPINDVLEIESPVICYGGSLIIDEDESILESFHIPDNTCREIYHFITAHFPEISANLYSDYDWFTEETDNYWVCQEEAITKLKAEKADISILFEKGRGIHKILCMGPAAEIDRLYQETAGKFPDLNIYKSSDTYLEFMDKKASKSLAMASLCRRYNTTPDKAIAFGDNFNDADMLKAAGLGIAMGNAPGEVKSQADYITADNDSEGISLALKRFL